jgi:outer membrane receptor protein involved in Fe transport
VRDHYYLREKKDLDIPIEVTAFGLELVGVPATTAGQAHTIAMMETASYAAYGQASYDIRADLTAELGLRYTHDEKRFRYRQEVDDILVGIPGIPIRSSASRTSCGRCSSTMRARPRATEQKSS